ncbi:hypothetical protein [Rubrolithibacter danxiaensis]|uniref:hypothetical protein n=1 Tax=Rubrolithibacter danxiaensis TaxID=3390805 RepID=UPI003BF83391
MKKYVSILLLCIHVFYIWGNVISGLTVKVVSNKIINSELIEIRVPVNLSGLQDYKEYELFNGLIHLKDATYHFVKFRLTEDAMYFICLPKTVVGKETKGFEIFAPNISDTNPKKNNDSLKKNSLSSEYNYEPVSYSFLKVEFIKPLISIYTPSRILDCFIDIPGEPPEKLSEDLLNKFVKF